jgi:AraC-like DNA-binding protein
MICGHFTLSRPSRGSLLELLPPVLLLKPTADGDWLEAILQRMVSESARERPGQRVALSRMTEVLFVEVLRSWIKSLGPGEGGWLGAMADPHIGRALQLIHERPERPWTLRDLGHHVGLGRSAFSARFTQLVGQSMHRYLIERRMAEAGVSARNKRRGDCTDCNPRRLRNRGRSTSRPIAWALPSSPTHWRRPKAKGRFGNRGCRLTSTKRPTPPRASWANGSRSASGERAGGWAALFGTQLGRAKFPRPDAIYATAE